MPWSDDARVMVHPFRAYASLAAAEDATPARTAATRVLFLLFVIGAFVSLTTAGRLVAFHVLSTMLFWSFLPMVQAAVFVVVLRIVRPPRPLAAQGLDLYFAGHGPWMVLFMAVAGVCLVAPHVYTTMMSLIRSGILPLAMLATIIWSGVITYACFRRGVGLERRRAGAATALFYVGFSCTIIGYYLAMNEIQPQLPVGAMKISHVAAALVALGLVAGTALDREPAPSVELRGGYRVLEADFHAHTRFADGFLSPFDLVVQARRRGLDVLAITDHNILFPARMGRWFSRIVGGPTILLGEEITTRRYHLHGVGLTERVDASVPLPEALAEIHRQGGVAIAAHPVGRYWSTFEAELDHIDAAEVMHPQAFGSSRGGWRWSDMRDFYERARAGGHRLTAVGSSDYHFFSPLGVCRTLLFATDDSEAAALDALKQGRTVVYDLEGHAYGDPELIAVLAREPYVMRPQDYGYRGSGALDRVARLLGWLGVLGLILAGRRRLAR